MIIMPIFTPLSPPTSGTSEKGYPFKRKVSSFMLALCMTWFAAGLVPFAVMAAMAAFTGNASTMVACWVITPFAILAVMAASFLWREWWRGD